MHRLIRVAVGLAIALVTLVVAGRAPGFSLQALQSPPVVKVCDLLPRAEVKKLIGGNQIFDMLMPEEEALGSYGSSCNYPGVMIQVMPFVPRTIEAARERGGLETVAGVGDEAHLYENPSGYVELYVKVGPRLVTLQRDIPMGQKSADVRPSTIALARALVAKLR